MGCQCLAQIRLPTQLPLVEDWMEENAEDSEAQNLCTIRYVRQTVTEARTAFFLLHTSSVSSRRPVQVRFNFVVPPALHCI